MLITCELLLAFSVMTRNSKGAYGLCDVMKVKPGSGFSCPFFFGALVLSTSFVVRLS